MLFFSTSAICNTITILPNVKSGLPTFIQEPNLYQAPDFDHFNFTYGYLSEQAEAFAELPIALGSIERVCIKTTFSEVSYKEGSAQSGVLVYTYSTNSEGEKAYNTTIGDRVALDEMSEHCFDESSWVYRNWLADKNMTFTPYSSSFAIIEDVRVVIQGELVLSQEPAVFVTQYLDFISKVGFDQSANFYHTDSIRELKALFEQGLDKNSQNVIFIKNIAFGTDVTIEEIAMMTDEEFMNTFLRIMEKVQGSNTINSSYLKVLNDFEYQDIKYIVVETREDLQGHSVKQHEVILLKKEGEYWKLYMVENLKGFFI